ncbi:MAG TPA: TonB-dependent receptor [Candidatus Sulfotelmatobacter sp.]|nr:TonB-dependent receptor [Candidatus Sulfotelmatobacter sp.]
MMTKPHAFLQNLCRPTRLGLFATMLLVTSLSLWAQVDKGSINGTVTDPSGAVIVGVNVTVTNVETGVTYTGASNNAGIYRISALPVGAYSIEYQKGGFKKAARTGLTLSTAQVAEVNITLQAGALSETVEVTTAPVLLDTETTDIGTALTANSMRDLPLDINASGVGRDITQFIYSNIATTEGGNWQGHIAGSQNVTKNVMVDGVDATAGLQGFIQSIGMEAVQEMNVQISGVTAEGASTGGGTVMLEMKSGTNQFHGSGFGFLQNEALNANAWDNNILHIQRPRNRFDDYGGSLGGPIVKDRTFFFGAYERFKNSQLAFAQNANTVPIPAFLHGDFSALLKGPLVLNGAPVSDACGRQINIGEIYNPLNPVVSGGNTCYQPFAGNIIPANQLSPIAVNIAKVYANGYAPTGSGLVNNFANLSGYSHVTSDHWDFKVDHNLNTKQRLSAGFNLWTYSSLSAGFPPGQLWQRGSSDGGPLSNGDNQPQRDWSARLQHFYTISPSLLNAFSIAYNQHMAGDKPPAPFDASKVGIPGTNGSNFPTINFIDNGFEGVNSGPGVNGVTEAAIGPPSNDRYTPYNFVIADTVSWVRGRHSFKFGGDAQMRGMNALYEGGIRDYNFTSQTLAPNVGSGEAFPFVGFAFANFMLGEVHDGSQSVTSALYGRRKRISLFASDDYKVNTRLTLNLGLRWDVNGRFHEKNGHWSNFDLGVNRGIWGPYNGGWEWAGSGGASFERNQNYHEFAPQVGVSYQALNKLVLRGHYGITYAPLAMNQWNGVPAFYPPGFTAGAFGFEGSNIVANNSPASPSFNWDTAPGTYPGQTVFPERIPTQSNVTGGVSYVWPDALTMGMVQNWNAGAEYELGKRTVLSLNYLGNHGTHLHDGSIWPDNFPTQSAFQKLYNSGHSLDMVTDPTSAGKAGVPFPFAGFSGPAYAAISPYPQIRSLDAFHNSIFLVNADLAASHYNAMVAEVKSNNLRGLTMDVNYTLSQTTGTPTCSVCGGAFADAQSSGITTQDPYLVPHLVGTPMPWDYRHQVKGYVVYDLPFGFGQSLKSHRDWLDNYLLGGWKIGMELGYRTGAPLPTIMSPTQYTGWSGVFAQRNSGVRLSTGTFKGENPVWVQSGGVDANGNPIPDPGSQSFNPAAFSSPANGTFSTEKYSYTGYLRDFGLSDEDLNIAKHFKFGSNERYLLSLRAQFFDVFNRHHWGTPNLVMGSPLFGHVTNAFGNRYGQLAARFEW